MQAMKGRDDARPLGVWVQFDDACWGGGASGGSPGEARRTPEREDRSARLRQ